MKVSIIGAGNLGVSIAFCVTERQLSDVVLVDIVEGRAQGKALDMMESGPVRRYNTRIKGTSDYAETADSDIFVIAAGAHRQKGMSRLDLRATNNGIIRITAEIVEKYANVSPSRRPTCIVCTEPVDLMTYDFLKITGFKPSQVIGASSLLDSTRLRLFIARELGISVRDVTAMVIGRHMEDMIILPQYCRVAGIPIEQFLSPEKIDTLAERTKGAGDEIVAWLKIGSSFYAPGSVIAEMSEAILRDTKSILPGSVYLSGQYGLEDVCIGVPVKLGKEGVEEIIQVKLTPEQKETFKKSAEEIKEAIIKR